MGFFGMFKEAGKITFSWKKLFSHIFLATILPLAILYLSDIQISYFIDHHTYQNNRNAKNTAHVITRVIYSILTLLFYLLSTSTVVYTVSCFYTSKDTNFKKVIDVFSKVWGRILVTFLLFFFVLAICTILYLGLLYWFVATIDGPAYKAFSIIIAFTIPYLIVFVYTAIVWNMAMVISVLEKDYGRKALVKSMKLLYGKIWVSSAVFVVLEIIFAGTIIAFSLLVLNRNILNLVGNIFVGIACYLLLPVLFHFSLVIQAVTYFVCKAYHNEDISNIAAHLDISYVTLGRRNEVV
ncbi:uncharacterized protein LOC113336046 [Papaver somniferum]|uniref:uncharacterized protein LOC113336046 n=1 Tax=Papaver somniferum TaxID=3469 RepID=UPI000E6FD4BB|nr:uncharacterized protein LOC113336046 [Papaver somniferum]